MKETDVKIIIFIFIHIIGAIILTIVYLKNGTFEYASKHGNGIRYARPSDVVFECLFMWEFTFIAFIFDSIEYFIDDYFQRKYNLVVKR